MTDDQGRSMVALMEASAGIARRYIDDPGFAEPSNLFRQISEHSQSKDPFSSSGTETFHLGWIPCLSADQQVHRIVRGKQDTMKDVLHAVLTPWRRLR